MSTIDKSNYVYNLLKEGLDAASLRGKVISNNIANVNTKGYKAYSVNFEDNLKDSIDSLEMKTTNEKHMKDSSKIGDIQVVQDKSTSMKEDGNNVDIDNEMTDLAANTLNYMAMITELNNRLAMQKDVINDGRK